MLTPLLLFLVVGALGNQRSDMVQGHTNTLHVRVVVLVPSIASSVDRRSMLRDRFHKDLQLLAKNAPPEDIAILRFVVGEKESSSVTGEDDILFVETRDADLGANWGKARARGASLYAGAATFSGGITCASSTLLSGYDLSIIRSRRCFINDSQSSSVDQLGCP